MPPAVHNPALGLHISGTRQRTFIECRRAWGFQFIAGILRPTTPNMKKGTALHWVGENWLRNGTPPSICPLPPAWMEIPPEMFEEAKRRFPAGIGYLPEPRKAGLYVEESFALPLTCGATYTGTIDYVDVSGEIPLVGDHKTTKTLQYVKTVEELRRDPQLLAYGYQVATFTKAPSVNFSWIYYRMTGEPFAVPVRFSLAREYLEKAWAQLDALATEMHALHAQGVDPLEIPGNYKSCSAYGGCHYAAICREKDPKMSSAASEGSSIFQQLKGAGAGGPPPTVEDIFAGSDSLTPAAVNPPAVIAPPFAGYVQTPADNSKMSVIHTTSLPPPPPLLVELPVHSETEGAKRRGRPKKTEEQAPAVGTVTYAAMPPALVVCIGSKPARGTARTIRTAYDLRTFGPLEGVVCVPADSDSSVKAVLETMADVLVTA